MRLKIFILFFILSIGLIYPSYAQQCEGPLTVTMVGASSALPISIEEEATGVFCTQSSEGSINIKVYGGTPQYDYKWAHEDLNQNFLIDLPVGSYHVTVSDANGCSEERTITIVNVDPITDSLDLVKMDACGTCYMHDGTQSFFYFEDEYIGALVDITTDKDLGTSMICTEIEEETQYCQGDPMLNRTWCFRTDSIEDANIRLFFTQAEMRQLSQASGFTNEVTMINSGTCYLNIFEFGKDDCDLYFPKRMNQSEFSTTKFDEDKGVWSIEIRDIDDACVKLLARGTTLPVDLLSFNGVTLEDKNRLYWTTANQENNEGFQVEKSKNGLLFNPIGFVKSTEEVEAEYTFDDLNPWVGSNFYKLKILDKDGQYKYSHIIHLVRKSTFDFVVVENPFRDLLNIEISTNIDIDANLSIFAVDGKLIRTLDYNLEEGKTNIQIETIDLTSGNYLIRFYNKTGKEFLTKKIVKF